jgi:hypothetical protein
MNIVRGTVKLDGQPLASGAIVADPAEPGGLPAQGGIVDGAFEFEATPGAKIIRISSTEATSEKDEYGEPISRDLIPARYNSASELKETVSDSGETTWSFDLKSK